jgi:hypothetical protein
MGHPLRTTFKDLAEEMVEDLERNGPDPTAGVSMYNCLCSCVDFGSMLGKEGLISDALPAFLRDPVLHRSADPETVL